MSFILKRIYKRKAILYFMLIISGLALDVLSFGLLRFDITASNPVVKVINLTAAAVLTFGIPLFILNILNTKLNSILRYSSYTLSGFQTLLSILHLSSYISRTFVKVPLYISILFSILYLIINLNKIGNSVIKKALISALTLTVFYLPLLIVHEFNFEDFYNNNSLILFFVSPMYSLLLNIILILFAYYYFNQPFYMKDNNFTNYFINKYKISSREVDVLLLVLKGKTREDIGGDLYISGNTVNNHIYNIYKKLNIKNRVQLLNLIQTNSN